MTLLAVIGSLGLAAAIYLDLLQKYQVDRFVSFAQPELDQPGDSGQADL
jgi:cell division protein FtsW (lipid II flippase)